MTLGIRRDNGNKFILVLLYASQQISQAALKQPQLPDDAFIINEASAGFSITGRKKGFAIRIYNEQIEYDLHNRQITE